jgi:hypothetical protein
MARRLQVTLLLLVVLGTVGLAGGLVARGLGAGAAPSALIGALVALATETALFAVPVRIRLERCFCLATTPDQVFAVATDPLIASQLNPLGPRIIATSGEPGSAGSTFTASLGGLRMVTRVLESDPPHEIVTEVRSRLNRVITRRTYTAVPAGTEVRIHAEHRMPLAAWLLRPVFAPELHFILQEIERRLRAHLETPVT